MSNKKNIDEIIRSTIEDLPNRFIEKIDRHSFKPSTYAEHGLSWIEKKIRLSQPDAKVHTPFMATALYGAYMDEFDEWRCCFPHIFKDFDTFQGCLIESKNLRASALNFKSRKDIKDWRGRPFTKDGVSLLIIDNTFLRILWSSFYYLIGQQYCPEMEEEHRKKKIVDTWGYDIELDSNYTYSSTELSQLKSVRSSFREYLTKEYNNAITPQSSLWINKLLQPQRDWHEVDGNLSNFCESVAIHFLYAHEFGHHCHSLGGNEELNAIGNSAEEIITSIDADSIDLKEELVCDLLGANNCWFRQRKTELLPTTVLVYMILWILHLSRALADRKNENITKHKILHRAKAAEYYLTEIIRNNGQSDFSEMAEHASRELEPVGRIFSKCIKLNE
ncbi:hypothetical protein RII68_003123 [Vibrio parahaemolyticus]|nr:hypothetical protein [Vibrio parahaemolyticus]EIO3965763.1 hypothetical protein [Vibrio parahaemolyticus]EIO3988292.1 hypothetical protein [Vibrio parahaemolyticus]EJT3519760.1 hypothetical protein [Vibrio parahaemolyticus]ELA9841197.1 hypothetical protein [Vibrio parahaemolyticus]